MRRVCANSDMNPDTAEIASVDPRERAASPRSSRAPLWPRCSARRPRRAGGCYDARRSARGCLPCATAGGRCGARGCWCGSAGVGTVLAFGFGPVRNAFDPPGVTQGLRLARQPAGGPGGALGRGVVPGDRPLRLPPRPGPFHVFARRAFFPLYPLGLSAISRTSACRRCSPGVLLSIAALALALYGIHRLTTLELGVAACGRFPDRRRPGRERGGAAGGDGHGVRADGVLSSRRSTPSRSTWRCRSGSSCARARDAGRGSACSARWPAATRSTGVVLMLPAVMLYLYGPREDRAPDFARASRAAGSAAYRLRRDVLWLGLVPAGLVVYMAYLAPGGRRCADAAFTRRTCGAGTSRGPTWACGTG